MVVVAKERRFARAVKAGVGADASGGRTAELLKVAASGRGVVPSCNAVWLPGRARRRGESWNVAVVSRPNDVMAELRVVDGAALRKVLLYSGWRCCCL